MLNQRKVLYVGNLRMRGSVGGEAHISGMSEALHGTGRLDRVIVPWSAAGLAYQKSSPTNISLVRVPPTPIGLFIFDVFIALFLIWSTLGTGRKILLVRPHLATWVQLLSARLLGWNVVYELNGISELEFESARRGRFLRLLATIQQHWASRFANIFQCVTPGIADWIHEKYGFDRKLLVVVPNAINPSEVEPITQRADDESQQKVADGVVVGFIGSLAPWQGLLEAISAVQSLDSSIPFSLVIVGSGTLESEIQAIIDDDQSGRIQLLPAVQRSEVAKLLTGFDYGLLTRNWPIDLPLGSPLKLYEYLGAGLPVIGSEIDGIRDLNPGSEFVRFVSPGDVSALADLFGELEKTQSGIRREIQAMTLASHTWEMRASQLIDELDSVLNVK